MPYGLYDMGGNVWQWCEDWFDASHKDRVLRGASWGNDDRSHLLSSYRLHVASGTRLYNLGFRPVLAPATVPAPSVSPTGWQPLFTPEEWRADWDGGEVEFHGRKVWTKREFRDGLLHVANSILLNVSLSPMAQCARLSFTATMRSAMFKGAPITVRGTIRSACALRTGPFFHMPTANPLLIWVHSPSLSH